MNHTGLRESEMRGFEMIFLIANTLYKLVFS